MTAATRSDGTAPAREGLVPAPIHRRIPSAPTTGAVVTLLLAVWGLRTGLVPLRDNSFLTHLATGRLILEAGVPTADVYSFTAPGLPWVVQSWLVSALYALVERVADGHGLVVLNGALCAGLAAAASALTRPAGGLLPRLGLGALAVGVGSGAWTGRPFLAGLLCLALVLLAANGRVAAPWLLVVGWVWLNSHGSFPLGVVALAALGVGARLDRDDAAVPARALRWLVAGLVVGALSPLGARLLWFPVSMLSRTDTLRTVVEWRSPDFDVTWQRLFLLQLVVVGVALVRRPSWRLAVPAVVFVPAALLSVRNVAVASLVLTAATAPAFAGLGSLPAALRSRRNLLPAAGAVALAGLFLAGAASRPAWDLGRYPVGQLAWLQRTGQLGGDARLVSHDWVGNYVELAYGPDVPVFLDDRVDMYPPEVVDDYVTLLHGDPDWEDVLDRHDAGVVLWEAGAPLAAHLSASPHWRVAHADDRWVVAVRA